MDFQSSYLKSLSGVPVFPSSSISFRVHLSQPSRHQQTNIFHPKSPKFQKVNNVTMAIFHLFETSPNTHHKLFSEHFFETKHPIIPCLIQNPSFFPWFFPGGLRTPQLPVAAPFRRGPSRRGRLLLAAGGASDHEGVQLWRHRRNWKLEFLTEAFLNGKIAFRRFKLVIFSRNGDG